MRGLYIWLVLYIAVSFGYYAAGTIALVQQWFYPSQYARVPFVVNDDTGVIASVQPEAKQAGISAGDHVDTLENHKFTGDYQLFRDVETSRPGAWLDTTIHQRDGAIAHMRVHLAAREGPPWSAGMIGLLVVILFLPLLSLAVAYWVVIARPRDINAWLVLAVLGSVELFFGNLDWTWWPRPWFVVLGFWHSLQPLMFPFLFLLGVYFPERWRADARWPWLKWVVMLPQFAGVLLVLALNYLQWFHAGSWSGMSSLDAGASQIFNIFAPLSIVLFWIAIFDKLRSASTADARRRLRVLVTGSALSLGPLLIIFGILPFFGINPNKGDVNTWVVPPFFALFPLTLAYVLVVQRAMDLRILVRMGTKYALARGMVWALRGGVITLLIYLFSVPTHHLVGTELRIAGIIALILLLRFRTFKYLSDWVDRKFFREAYNTEVVLTELSEQVRRFTEQQPLIETVAQRISDVLHVPQIAVWLRGSTSFHLQQALGTPVVGPMLLANGSATVEAVARADHPVTLYRDSPDAWFAEAPAEERRALDLVNAEVLLGLPGRDRLMGVMALGPKQSEEPYSSSDLRLLRTVATQTGLALEVGELAHSLAREAAQRERIHREMEIAREVQERLFPQRIPQIPGLDLAGYCRPAQSVGGDYYDFIELESGRLGIAIGDISGKGISAALLMASLRASLRGMTLYGADDLAALMGKVNRLVYEASASNRYATFFFAVYDPGSRELHYVNAGHNPPVLVGADKVKRLEIGGPVVGLLPSVPYMQGSVTLAPGDVLLAYTDGISEAMTTADEEWGEERMIAALELARSKNAAEIVAEIFRAADDFTAGAPQHDDMTLVVVKLD